jgi:hypothetical protein
LLSKGQTAGGYQKAIGYQVGIEAVFEGYRIAHGYPIAFRYPTVTKMDNDWISIWFPEHVFDADGGVLGRWHRRQAQKADGRATDGPIELPTRHEDI